MEQAALFAMPAKSEIKTKVLLAFVGSLEPKSIQSLEAVSAVVVSGA